MVDQSGDIQVSITALEPQAARLKLMKSRLQQALQWVEEAKRTQSEFLANMTHEMRTPMYGITGMLDLTLETPLSDTQREYLLMAKRSAGLMLRLISDIFDFSKMEAGKMDLEEARLQLSTVVESVMQPLSLLAREKALELSWSIDSGCPHWLWGDAERLSQVLNNIVGNAIKFTEKGHVQLAVTPEAADATTVLLHFCVSDSGIGIPEDRLEDIYTPFTQVDGSITRKYGGAGLGLSISRHLVELMDGHLWCESKPGCGSVFHFTICFNRISVNCAVPTATVENGSPAKMRGKPAPAPFSSQVFDFQSGLKHSGGKPEVLRRHIDGFLKNAPALIAKLQKPVREGEEFILERAATELREVASHIGADKISDNVFRLQLAIRKGDSQRFNTLHETIIMDFDAFKTAVTRQSWSKTTKEACV